MLERYIVTDGEEYICVNCVREALGIKEDEDIFLAIKRERDLLRTEIDNLKDNIRIKDNALKTVKKERDELKEKCEKLKKWTNAAYGASCGYSGDKPPAFLCDVVSCNWELGYFCCSGTALNDGRISVRLELTPTSIWNGTLNLEDLTRYIQNYGREKKLGVVESVDYQNAKAARAELAHLYKTVLGKDRLDRDLSPHEVMKAILDEVKKLRDSQLAFSQCLRSVYMHVCDGPDCKVSDIYAAPDKLAECIVTRYNSTKKLSDFEVFCKLVDNCIDELCDKYNVVQPDRNRTTRERLDYIFTVLGDYREMHDSEWKRVEGLKKDKQALSDSLAELRAKVREIYRSVVDDEWDEHLSYTSALNDINEEYKRVVHNFEERTADWSKAQQEYSRYRLAVESLLDIPKETRGDINAIERAFEFSKKQYKSLQEFRDSVCEILDIPSSMADNQILEELHDIADRYDELEDFRADIWGVLDIDELIGTPRQNDGYILEQIETLEKDSCKPTVFRNDVAVAIGMTQKDSNPDIIKRVMEIRESHDRLARLRSNICTALCLGGEKSDEDILKRVRMTKECHDKLCKDYTELRKAIWDAMDRKPETLPEETARLVGEVGEVAELARGEKLLIEFRDDVAKAIGISYPTTNNFILKRVADIYKERGEAHDLAMGLDRKCIDLTAKNSDLQQKLDTAQKQVKGFTNRCDSLETLRRDLWELRRNAIEDLKSRGFCFRPEENETLPEIYDKLLKRYDWAYGEYKEQYRLRQMWHVRWESENERANGVQKALDREREKCRVKDISLETAKKQYEKVCGNLETAECALNGMKSKVRSLQEEKTKVISALGQDIWDDAVK